MKRLAVIFTVFVAAAVGAAVWFSPFAGRGAYIYKNNERALPVGVSYAPDAAVRYDICGGEADMYAELEKLSAAVVQKVVTDGVTVVYAISDRVCGGPYFLADGKRYNVMAAYRDGHIAIGAPILEGAY